MSPNGRVQAEVFAWSGDDADTIVELNYFTSGLGIFYSDPNFLDDFVPLPTVTTSRPGQTCTTFFGDLPPGLADGAGNTCRMEAVSTSANVVINIVPPPDVSLQLPEQTIIAIRQEFTGVAP